MKKLTHTLAVGVLALSLIPTVATAQSEAIPDLMIVLDGSGSMWGQIEGRTKIEIARETLSSVLSEASLEQNMGMITYGHRVRGQCSDIELMVPLAPAAQSVPQIIVSANGLNPIGMTPLSDSVRQAADYLRFTENAATVVLITDGIETCNADPCALGNELARLGLDFRAHVVGFGMSEEEGAQVACLAENTGGQFFLANDPQALADALAQTLSAPEDFIPEEEITGDREVHFLLRDVAGGDLLRGAPTLSISVVSEILPDVPDVFIPAPTIGSPYSASISLPQGNYGLAVGVASGNQRQAYAATVSFTVEPGEGPQIVDRVLGARLRIVPMISSNEAFDRSLPSATGGSPRLDFLLTPVIDGQPMQDRAVRVDNMGTLLRDGAYEAAFGSGTWLVRGTLAGVFAREKLVEIVPGETTELVFDFAASRVIFDFDDGGTPVRTPTVYPHEGPDARAWAEARWRSDRDGSLLPLFMPVGTWLLRGGDYHNQTNRAELIVEVPDAGQTITVRPRSGDAVDGDDMGIFSHPSFAGCFERLGSSGSGPCLVEKVQF